MWMVPDGLDAPRSDEGAQFFGEADVFEEEFVDGSGVGRGL